MNLSELEKSFNRALLLSFSKKKFLLAFPILGICGLIVVLCRTVTFNASGWIVMSLIFLSIFLSSSILLSLGILLIRVYYHEVRNLKASYLDIIKKSWDLILETSYLSIPILFAYLFLWIIFGVFILFKEIPYVGQTIGIILTFAPFLIILISIILCLFYLSMLFFVSPAIALKSEGKLNLLEILEKIPKHLLSNLIFLGFGLFPLILVVGILTLAAILTGISYFASSQRLSIAFQWFFVMIPFCAFVTPFVIFFFNFAAESYNFVKKGSR
jgi:hypothetical protein